MFPYEPTDPQIPAAPFEIPTPDLPSANFQAIAQQQKQGEITSGFWQWLLDLILKWIPDAIGAVMAALLGVFEQVIAFLLHWFYKIWHQAEFGQDQIAAEALNALFPQLGASAATFQNAAGGGREALSSSLAIRLVSGIGTGTTGQGGSAIAPSTRGADNFINHSVLLGVEGWLQEAVFGLVPGGILEKFGDLKDSLNRSLGFGRLAARILRPPVKTLVTDPYTWFLNDLYRPTKLQPELLVREYLRGLIDQPTLNSELGYHGYAPDKITALLNFNQVHLSLNELDNLVAHQLITNDQAIQSLVDQGYTQATAFQALQVKSNARVDSLARQVAQEAIALYAQGRMDQGQLDQYIKGADITAVESQYFSVLAELKKLGNVKRFTLGQAEQLVKKGLWDLTQFRDLLLAEGYTLDDETTLELLTFLELKQETDAAAAKKKAAADRAAAAQARAAAAALKAAEAKAAAEARGVSISKYETLVKDGVKTMVEYRAFLTAKGIAPDNITALATVLQAALDKAATGTAAKPTLTAAAKTKNLDLAQLEASVKAGILTLGDYQARLVTAGFDQADVTILVELLSDQLATAAAKVSAKTAAGSSAKARGLSLAEEERGVRLGLVSVADYATWLTAHGYDTADVALLVGEINAQLAADAAARATKKSVSGALKARGISLVQLEKAVRAGVRSIADYQAALAAAGYGSEDQATLVSLLQLAMAQDQATLAAEGRAGALLGERAVSLANLERAVKLGVVPISVYTDALTRNGVDASDIQLLTLSLAAQIKTTKTGTTAAASASKLVAALGLNLATLERDVINGKLDLGQFQAVLTNAGVSDAELAAISQVVSDQQANVEAIKALTSTATKRAVAKGLSLSEETAAVKAGVKTIDDYFQFVIDLGFDEADAETLTATLEAALTKPKAKGPGTPPPSPAPAPGP